MGERDQPVGLAAHRGDHHDHVVALGAKARDLVSHLADTVGVADGSAAEFLDQ
jgi:hypothetical protein